MAVDLTPQFWDATKAAAQRQGLPQEKLAKLRSAQILRSFATRSAFSTAASDVSKAIRGLAEYIAAHRREYVQIGKLSETDRNAIEAHIQDASRQCADSIQQLEQHIDSSLEAEAGHDPQTLAALKAHRAGMTLCLHEYLANVVAVFSEARSVRYQQLQRQQEQLKRRRVTTVPAATSDAFGASQMPNGLHYDDSAGPSSMQQQVLQEETAALQQELTSRSRQAHSIEEQMVSLGELMTTFSTLITRQGEQIEQLYYQAVEQTERFEAGNVQLGKAIRLNSTYSKFLIVIFAVLCFVLLFLDWFYS